MHAPASRPLARQVDPFRRLQTEQFIEQLGEDPLHLGIECAPDEAYGVAVEPDQIVLTMLPPALAPHNITACETACEEESATSRRASYCAIIADRRRLRGAGA
jgi:hypothetical protein